MMAKECLPFTKYSALHELEAKHGVDLGYAYRTKDSARRFSHFIARSQRFKRNLHQAIYLAS